MTSPAIQRRYFTIDLAYGFGKFGMTDNTLIHMVIATIKQQSHILCVQQQTGLLR